MRRHDPGKTNRPLCQYLRLLVRLVRGWTDRRGDPGQTARGARVHARRGSASLPDGVAIEAEAHLTGVYREWAQSEDDLQRLREVGL